jgi:dCTP diphosphatase
MIVGMSEFERLTKLLTDFREERDWKQFHSPKDMALSLMLEAGEVAELFQWKNNDEQVKVLIDKQEDLSDELADVLAWVLLIAHDSSIDLVQALENKIKKNEAKYPAELVKGSAKKYTEYK